MMFKSLKLFSNKTVMPFLYPRHTKYAKGVYSFCLFCVCVCVCVCLSVCALTYILCQRFFKNYYT